MSEEGWVSITLKGGKGYEDTWLKFSANSNADLRAQLNDFFGTDAEAEAELTLSQVVFNRQQEWHATNAVNAGSGGARAVGRSSGRKSEAYAAAAEPPPEPKDVLAAQIEEVADVTALKRLYAENEQLFKDNEDLVAAYKAKGRALSSK